MNRFHKWLDARGAGDWSGEATSLPYCTDPHKGKSWPQPERATLTALAPGLDNRSVHQSPRARAAMEAAGGQLVCLPTSSPDVKPIELAFATTKTHVRRAQARAWAAIVAALGAALATVPPADAQAFYHAAGDRW